MEAKQTSGSTIEKENEHQAHDRPRYETPRIQELSERDILNSFQLTQSMASWWAKS